jgi:hypothetical protein
MQLRVVLIAVIASACVDAGPADLATDFRETPFRYLRGVELGMTAKRLHALRPAARFAPYLGLQERLPGYVVSYQFPTSMDAAVSDVAPNDQLDGVFITETFDSMEKADSAWRDGVRAVSSNHRAPSVCDTFPAGGMQARWFAGKRVLAIGAFPRERLAINVTDRVIYAISPTETMKQPAGATKTACPKT